MWNIYDLKESTQMQSGNGRCPWTSACCSILCYPPPTYPLCARTIRAFRSEGGLTAGLTVGSGYLCEHCFNKIRRKFSYMTSIHLPVFFSVLLTCLKTLLCTTHRDIWERKGCKIEETSERFACSNIKMIPMTSLFLNLQKSKHTCSIYCGSENNCIAHPSFCILIYIMWADKGQRSSPSQIPLS